MKATRAFPCPCCGGLMPEKTDLQLAIEACGPTMGAILRVIARNPGTSAQGIAAKVYANVKGDGPEYADEVVRVTIHRERHKLVDFGWKLIGSRGPSGGYALCRIE